MAKKQGTETKEAKMMAKIEEGREMGFLLGRASVKLLPWYKRLFNKF